MLIQSVVLSSHREAGLFVGGCHQPPREDAKQLLFAITPLGDGAPPPFWEHVDGVDKTTTLRFGAVGWCNLVDMEFPKTGEGKFEIRAIDLAGNESPPATITVRYEHPHVLERTAGRRHGRAIHSRCNALPT